MISAPTISLSTLQLTNYLFGIVALLASACVFGYLFERFKLPKVIGELVGGIALGPSLLGFLSPGVYTYLFNAFPAEGQWLGIVYELGLVFLMFISGYEIQKFLSKDDRKLVGALMICTTAIPLIAGWLIVASSYNFSSLIGSAQNLLAFRIVFATAVAVTSIPVISKIFIDLKLIRTRFAKVVLGAATVHDTVLYTGLAIATGLVSAKITSAYSIAVVIIMTILFFLISLIVVSRILKFLNRSRYNVLLKSSPTGYLLLILFLFSAAAVLLNVNIMFGAFLAGITVSMIPNKLFDESKSSIRNMSLALFVPLYFAIVGLQIDLIHYFDPLVFLVFLIGSSLLQMLGTFVATKICKLDRSSSLNLAITINARGGPGIVLATTAFGLGIISESFFVTLIMSAIVTSLFAGWWLRSRVQKREELLNFTSARK